MPSAPRTNCYRCHRPQVHCLCGSVTPVDNRTAVTILQHPRESRHPLGTVRLARLGLRNVEVHVADIAEDRSLHHPLDIPENAGLLYPSPDAAPLLSGANARTPGHLVVLDGTWWQARRLYRDNPWLAGLPHYRLSPSSPSQYRVRREPAAHCLSTIESIVSALEELEPETTGLDALRQSFVSMIDRHIALRPAGTELPRSRRKRQCAPRAIPRALTTEADRVVLVYGESLPQGQRSDPARAELLQWVAVRPSTGQVFEAFIGPDRRLDGAHARRLELSPGRLEPALTLPDFLASWHEFLGPDARWASWNASIAKLFHVATGERPQSLCLKHAYCNLRDGLCGTLEAVADREGLSPVDLPLRGRAARRLGNALALLRFLQDHAARSVAPYQPKPPKPSRRSPVW